MLYILAMLGNECRGQGGQLLTELWCNLGTYEVFDGLFCAVFRVEIYVELVVGGLAREQLECRRVEGNVRRTHLPQYHERLQGQ